MANLSTVVALEADAFEEFWRSTWKQGEHVAILGQTGSGKTTLASFLCGVRKYVIAVDPKGLDSTLSATGWPRIKKWPMPAGMRNDIKDGRPVRIIVGGPTDTDKQWDANNALLRRVVKDIWRMGRFCLWADEGQILSDKRYVNAGESLEKMLIAARDRLISLVYCVQRPAIGRTSPAATAAFTQSTWIFVSHTRDQRVHDRLAEIVGRPAPEIRGLISALPKYYWACFSLDPHEPVRIFIPPKPKPSPPSKADTPKTSSWFW